MKNDDDIFLTGTAAHFAASKRRSYRKETILLFRTLVDFLQNNGLTSRTILGTDEDVTKDLEIWASDLTEEGFEFFKNAEPKWLAAIDRGKSPTDTSILKKQLAKMRMPS